jgi:multidrug efflux system membrane fusion protein
VPVVLLTVTLLAACGQDQPKGPPPKPPVPVKVDRAVTRTVPLQVQAVGTVEARATVQVRARVSGQLTQIHFREGDDLRKGASLFTIDPAPYQIALRQAEARLQKSLALAATAREKERRYQTLTGEGLISTQDYDLIKAEAESLEASVAADLAAVEEAGLHLAWTRITAPLDGRAGSLLAHAGDLITANAGQPLVVIHQVEPIDVSFTLPERELPRLRQTLAAGVLSVQAIPEGTDAAADTGNLTFIDNAVDSKTGTIRLKAAFANSKRTLWPGQFVTTTITLATIDNATVVPSAAIQTGQQGTTVFVAREDGSAELRPVKTGIAVDGFTIIAEGLQPGEAIVVDGQMRLTHGAKLDIKTP